MRLLVASDLHASDEALDALSTFAAEHKPEAVLIAGDLTHFGPAGYIAKLLQALDCPVLAVNGNCDTPQVVKELAATESCVMDRAVHLGTVVVGGVAWEGRRSLDRVSGELEVAIERVRGDRPLVLLSHSPAKGHVDEPGPGTHLGSEALSALVERVKPIVLVSGHIHESRGVERAGDVLYVNPGPAMYGLAAMLEIEGRSASAKLL